MLAVSSLSSEVAFRFDARAHSYTLLTGEVRPHVTGMLEDTGKTDSTWYTDESSERGKAVHSMTADYDLGALEREDVVALDSDLKGYLQAHLFVMGVLQPEVLEVEVPRMHPHYLYGARKDRVMKIDGAVSVYEIKSGLEHSAHQLQTALQAMVIGALLKLPAPAIRRYIAYYSPNGRGRVFEHTNRHDFSEALEIVRKTCR